MDKVLIAVASVVVFSLASFGSWTLINIYLPLPPTPASAAPVVEVLPTVAPTSAPTNTDAPTSTPEPTETPLPTFTPTPLPIPTSTPTEPASAKVSLPAPTPNRNDRGELESILEYFEAIKQPQVIHLDGLYAIADLFNVLELNSDLFADTQWQSEVLSALDEMERGRSMFIEIAPPATNG